MGISSTIAWGDEQPIERVTMVHRQTGNLAGMKVRDIQLMKAVLRHNICEFRVEGPRNYKLSQTYLDGHLPDGSNAVHRRVVVILDGCLGTRRKFRRAFDEP